jgi:hypothetical protein
MPPGWYGLFTAPKLHHHFAGAHGTSTARKDRHGTLHPAVWLKFIMGVIGTGPRYHVLEGLMDADMAEELGQILLQAAKQSRLDMEAGPA